MGVLPSPAVEQHAGFTVRHIVAVGVGDEEQFGRGPHPHAAEADLETADEVQPLLEDRSLVEHMVAIGVFEDENPVLRRLGSHPSRIGIGLGHPEPAAVVEAHGDRLADVGLRGQQLHHEAGRHRHRFDRRGGSQTTGQRQSRTGRAALSDGRRQARRHGRGHEADQDELRAHHDSELQRLASGSQ